MPRSRHDTDRARGYKDEAVRHPRTYSLVGGGLDMFLVTDDESGMNIGYARKIGGPLTKPMIATPPPATPAACPYHDIPTRGCRLCMDRPATPAALDVDELAEALRTLMEPGSSAKPYNGPTGHWTIGWDLDKPTWATLSAEDAAEDIGDAIYALRKARLTTPEASDGR